MKVALDTNVLAGALGTRGLCADLLRVVLLEHELVVGEAVLTELRKNLVKKFRLAAAVVAENEAFLRAHTTISTNAQVVVIEGVDPEDARVLSEALAAQADVFVTGDQALQVLGERAPLPVVSLRQFWTMLREPG